MIVMQRNLIEANLLSGDKGPALLQQKFNKRDTKSILQEILYYDFSEVIDRTAINSKNTKENIR